LGLIAENQQSSQHTLSNLQVVYSPDKGLSGHKTTTACLEVAALKLVICRNHFLILCGNINENSKQISRGKEMWETKHYSR
jgi:hypothetical protein